MDDGGGVNKKKSEKSPPSWWRLKASCEVWRESMALGAVESHSGHSKLGAGTEEQLLPQDGDTTKSRSH